MKTTNIFLSSTTRDLSKYREAVARAIRGLNAFHLIQMEDWSASHASPAAVCREKLALCDVLVLVAGHFYGGSPPDSGKSFTELEYELALDHEKDVLVFLAVEDFPISSNVIEPDEIRTRQAVFRRHLLSAHHCVQFRDRGHLAQSVVVALANWRETQYGVILQQTEESRSFAIVATGVAEAGVRRSEPATPRPVRPELMLLPAAPARSVPQEDPAPVREAKSRGTTLADLFDVSRWKGDDLLSGHAIDSGNLEVVEDIVRERVTQALDINVADVVISAWKRSETFRKYLDPAQTPGKEMFLQLAEHRIRSTYHPEWQLAIKGRDILSFRVDVDIELTLAGAVARFVHNDVVQVQLGRVRALGTVQLNGTVIADVDASNLSGLSNLEFR